MSSREEGDGGVNESLAKKSRSNADYENEYERLRQLSEETKKELEETKALSSGTFYTTFDKIWETNVIEFTENDFNTLVRRKSPSFDESVPRDKPHNSFIITINAADGPGNIVKDGSDSATTSHSHQSDKTTIWGCHVLKIPPLPLDDDIKKSIPSRPSGHIAHLVPAHARYASLYFDIAKWVFGEVYTNPSVHFSVIQRLIHGAATAEEGSPPGKRIPHTGLKHMICNKIRLRGQADFYDKDPFILIVPILTTEDALKWNGEGYSAIFAIATDKGMSIQEVATEADFINEIDLAEKHEIETARELLETVLKGLAFSLQRMDKNNAPFRNTHDMGDDVDVETSHFLGKEQWDIISGLQRLQIAGKVLVPSKLTTVLDDDIKVAKITFWPHGTLGGHPAPDPILLATKAGINWSKFYGKPLLAGGAPVEDSESDDQSDTAEQNYLEWAQRLQAKRRHDEILGMRIGVGGELQPCVQGLLSD